MKKFNLIFFSLISSVILQSSFAWAQQNKVSVFSQKIKSEAVVAHKVTEALEKNLDSKLFVVKAKTEISPVSLEVQKIHITLQLSQQFTQKYRTQLTKWIKQWVESTYGLRGDAKVEWMPVETVQSVSVVWSDLVILSLLLAAAVSLLARTIIKARPPVQLSFGFIDTKKKSYIEVAVEESEEVFTVPAEQLAFTIQPEIRFEFKAEPQPEIKFEVQAEKTVSEIANEIETEAETLVIEPLVSVEPFIETEAETAIEIVSPFAFIEQINNKQLKNLFFFFDLSLQVAFFMKAPRTSVQRLTSVLDKKIVVQILAESALLKEASDEDLTAAMQLWQEAQQNEPMAVEVVEANEKFLRLKEIWLELFPKDKALLLEKLSKENPEIESVFLQGQEQVNSLKSWSPEKLRKFCMQMRTRDLAAAIKELPFLNDTILEVCPQSMKKAIQFEAHSMDDAKTDFHFESFVTSFERYISKATAPKLEANLLQIRTKLLE